MTKAPLVAPPPPWRRIPAPLIGGITEVGFAEQTEMLLVLSHQGRGIIDCSTGKKVARDDDDDRRNWYGRNCLIAKGIGPLEQSEVLLSGLWGGGLPTMTKDTWTLARATLEWPTESLFLLPPASSIFQKDAQFYKVAEESELRAFGFSYTGKTIIVASSSDLIIFWQGLNGLTANTIQYL